MNKIFTLFACAAVALGTQAAAPEMLFRGQPVASGETVQTGYIVEVIEDEIPGWGTFTSYQYTQDTHLDLRGDKTKQVTVQFSATGKMQFCGIIDQCDIMTSGTRTNVLGSAPGAQINGNNATVPLKLDIITDDMEGTDPAVLLKEVTATVSAWYNDSPSDKVTVTVKLLKVPDSDLVGSVSSVAGDAAAVKYCRGMLDYTVAAPAKLEVYSTSGALVISRMVSATGSVSLESLRPGVYIYSLAGKTGKIIR